MKCVDRYTQLSQFLILYLLILLIFVYVFFLFLFYFIKYLKVIIIQLLSFIYLHFWLF